jgi:flagellar M-ring protein FliF
MNSLIDSIFGRNVAARKIAIGGVGVLVMGLVLFISFYGVQPPMLPLVIDVPAATASQMTAKLTELTIPWEFGNTDGTIIKVKQEDMARARVALAAEGLTDNAAPGWSLFDKATWGMTDFTQKVNFGRAIEGELVRTISGMKNVSSAQVHLALEEQSLFKANERPSKASVTLKMKTGDTPPQSVVQGIARLVAASVGGLDAQHVTIVDEHGNALTSDDDGTLAGMTSRQLAVQREIESSLEKGAQELLQSLVGSGNSKVRVSASVNFDQVERTTQSVDPDKQATATEQKAEVLPGTPAQGAGYNTTATTYDNTHTAEVFKGTSGNIRKMTVAVLVADKVTMPPLDTTVKTPAAPIVTARTPEELAKIETLMRNALGVDSTRGDAISVISAPFDLPVVAMNHDTMPTPNLITRLQANPKPPMAIGAFAVLLIVSVVMMLALKPKKVIEAPAAQLAAASAYPELQGAPAQQQLREAAMRQQQQQQDEEEEFGAEKPKLQYRLPAISTSAEREQAIATVEQRPEAAIRVTKNWLRV